jgi:hypothetical protein
MQKSVLLEFRVQELPVDVQQTRCLSPITIGSGERSFEQQFFQAADSGVII